MDPVAFLLLNNISPPSHWHVNITHVAPVSPVHVARAQPEHVPGFTVTHSSEAASWSASTWLLTTTPGMFGLVSGLANPTGVVLVIIILFLLSF